MSCETAFVTDSEIAREILFLSCTIRRPGFFPNSHLGAPCQLEIKDTSMDTEVAPNKSSILVPLKENNSLAR